MSFLAVKNVVKCSVTKFKPIFCGGGGSDRNFAIKNPLHVSLSEFQKFHDLELLGPLSCKKSLCNHFLVSHYSAIGDTISYYFVRRPL